MKPGRPSAAAVVVSVATVVVLYWVGFTRTEAARHFVFGRAAPRLHFVDGTYLGVGSSRHGRIRATVTVSRGRITAAAIADCRMRYPCEMIAALPPQVVARQSSEVDIVSGASDSSEAFWRAARDALSQAGSGTAAQGPGR